MSVPVANITIYAGQTTYAPFAFEDTDLSDYTGWSCELRSEPGGALFGSVSIVIDDAAAGQLTLVFPATLTEAVSGTRAAYDLFAVDPAGAVVKFVEGPECDVVERVTATVPSDDLPEGESLAETLADLAATVNNLSLIPGPEGPQGPQGPQGDPGADGADGTIVSVGTVAPSSPSVGDLWVDTN